MEHVNYKIWNIVVVLKEGQILLIERRKGDFGGYVPPGGKVDFPEAFMESAVRELREETGLVAKSIRLAGVSSYINEQKREQFMYMDYLCTDFEGELLVNGPEGRCSWFDAKALPELPMNAHIKQRVQLVLTHASYELQHVWDEETDQVVEEKLFVAK